MNVEKIFARYKLNIDGDKIFDLVRHKYINLTPEEVVRQQTLKFLINRLAVPQDKIIVERSLGTLGVKGNKKRIDIGILDEDGIIMAVVECKAPNAYDPDTTFFQAQNYLRELNTRYFFVTDGKSFNGYYYDTVEDIKLDTVQKYDRWYYYPTSGKLNQ